jgi:hypothetical protein
MATMTPFNFNANGGRIPPGVKGGITTISPMLPIRAGGPAIAPTLPIVSGIANIAPNERRQSVDNINDVSVTYHLVSKPWAPPTRSAMPTYGDQTPYLGHQFQLRHGDMCFINRSISGNSGNKSTEHQVISADLAKLNEILAVGYDEIKKSFNNNGLGFSDANYYSSSRANPHSSSSSSSSSSSIHGINYKHILQGVYKVLYPDRPSDSLNITEFFDILTTIENFEHDIDTIAAQENEDTDDSNDEEASGVQIINDSNTAYITSSRSKQNLNYPDQANIYAKYYQLFPEKNRFMNSLGYFNSKDDYKAHYGGAENDEQQNIEEMLELFVKNKKPMDQISNYDIVEKIQLKTLLRYALTELFGSSDKYIKFCTLAGVVNQWSFFGIVQNTGDGITTDQVQRPTANSSVVNYVIERAGSITNRWGNSLPAKTELWVIVKKLSPKGPYQFIPWHSKNKNSNFISAPTGDDLMFLDEDGVTPHKGQAIYIGEVRLTYGDAINDESRRIANGIVDPTNNLPVPFSNALDEKANIASTGKIDVIIKY